MHHQSIARIKSSLICPACSHPLRNAPNGFSCAQCKKAYLERDGIPELIAQESKHKADEAAYHSSISSSYQDMHQLNSYRNRFFHLRALEPLLSLPSGTTILELGCGTGFDAIPLLMQAHLVAETDISRGQVLEAKRQITNRGLNERALFYIADAEAIPFADETFDASFIVACLHHLKNPSRGLREMARCTRSGGSIIIAMEPNRTEWVRILSFPFSIAKFIAFRIVGRKKLYKAIKKANRYREPATERTFTKQELRALARDAGFTIKKVEAVWFLCGFNQWLVTLLNKLSRNRWSMNADIERFCVYIDRILAILPFISSFCGNWTLHCIKE